LIFVLDLSSVPFLVLDNDKTLRRGFAGTRCPRCALAIFGPRGYIQFAEQNMGISLDIHRANCNTLQNAIPYSNRHGHIEQGQRIDTAKPGLRTGEVALHPGLGLLVLRQPDKQA